MSTSLINQNTGMNKLLMNNNGNKIICSYTKAFSGEKSVLKLTTAFVFKHFVQCLHSFFSKIKRLCNFAQVVTQVVTVSLPNAIPVRFGKFQ